MSMISSCSRFASTSHSAMPKSRNRFGKQEVSSKDARGDATQPRDCAPPERRRPAATKTEAPAARPTGAAIAGAVPVEVPSSNDRQVLARLTACHLADVHDGLPWRRHHTRARREQEPSTKAKPAATSRLEPNVATSSKPRGRNKMPNKGTLPTPKSPNDPSKLPRRYHRQSCKRCSLQSLRRVIPMSIGGRSFTCTKVDTLQRPLVHARAL